MSRCPTFTFQLPIMFKWLAKQKSTNVSFKITIRKKKVYVDIRWSWIWNQYFYLVIWNNDPTKIRVLLSFQLPTRLNSRNTNETEIFNEIWHINLYMDIGISIGIIEDSTTRKWIFYFIWVPYTITDLQPPYSLCYITRCKKWSDV